MAQTKLSTRSKKARQTWIDSREAFHTAAMATNRMKRGYELDTSGRWFFMGVSAEVSRGKSYADYRLI